MVIVPAVTEKQRVRHYQLAVFKLFQEKRGKSNEFSDDRS